MKMSEIVSKKMMANAGSEKLSVDSRQQKAARVRKATFEQINIAHGLEPRRIRRKLAIDIARRMRREGNKKAKISPSS